MPFRDILAVLWRRKWIVAVCMAVAVAGAGAYLKLRAPSYSAAAGVQVQLPSNGSAGAAVNIPDPVVALSSAKLVENAASLAGGHLDAQVSGSFDQSTDILTLSATGPTARGVEVAANAYAQAYVNYVQAAAQGQIDKLGNAVASLDATIQQLEAQDPAGKNPAVQAQITSTASTAATLGAQKEGIQVNGPYAVQQQSAGIPSGPSGANKSKIGGLAVVVGLLTGFGIALVREQFDTSLHSDVDVEASTGRPVLAELPIDPTSARSDRVLSVVEEPQSLLAESIRELRTSLRVLLEEKPGALVMVTSPAPGDGKTTVTANLGAAWAMVDRQVIIVSADFRRPRIETMFGLEPTGQAGLAQLARFRNNGGPIPVPGYSEVRRIPSREDVAERLIATTVSGLYLLPSGGAPRYPSELLDGPAMTAVLGHLASLADVVLFDAPPVLAVTDPAILGRSMTGVVVVVSEGGTDRQDLESTVSRLDATGARVLGMVLNRARAGSTATYHRYHYSP